MIEVNDNTDFFAYIDGLEKLKQDNVFPIFSNEVEGAIYTISITVYKRAQFLRQCLESALQQDIELPYQILVIDDDPIRGNEVEMLMQEYHSNPLVTYYKKFSNEGLMANMNRAIQLAKTDWVLMIHDDDWLCSNYLSVIDKYRYLYKNYTIFVPSHTTFFFDKFVETKSSFREWLCKMKGCWSIKPIDFITGTCATPTGTIYHRDSFIQSGGYIDDYGYAADYVFFARYSSYEKIMRINEKLFNYRFAENESLKQDTVDNFKLIGHYLSVFLLRRYKFINEKKRSRFERARLWKDFNGSVEEIRRVLGEEIVNKYQYLSPLPFFRQLTMLLDSAKLFRCMIHT